MNAPNQAHLPVSPYPQPTGEAPLPFAGLSVIVTGEVDGFSRFSANEAISRLGGKPVTSVSSKTGLVIVGEGAGISKMHKTRLHRLNVIGGPDFTALAADPHSWDGTPVGEPVADYEARIAAEAGEEPEPDPTPAVPFDQRHLVGKACHYPRVNGKVVREVIMWCSCGHKWHGETIHDDLACPVEAGTATLDTEHAWFTADPQTRWDYDAIRSAHEARTAAAAPPRPEEAQTTPPEADPVAVPVVEPTPQEDVLDDGPAWDPHPQPVEPIAAPTRHLHNPVDDFDWPFG